MNNPLPVIYADEQAELRASCVVCRGRVFRAGSVASCLLCGREVADVLDTRPQTVARWYEDDTPKRGRPKSAPGTCGCGGHVTSWARSGLCRTCYLERSKLPSKTEWPPCEVDGCTRVRKTFSSGLCGRHASEQRQARKAVAS